MASTEIDRLVTVWDADINRVESKLDKMVRSHNAAAHKVEGAWNGVNVNHALESIFSRSRLSILEEGGLRLGVAAGALEHLGAVGIAAAAGIAAATVAFEEARKAAEFADAVEKAAKAAHVSTDAIQELRFALQEAGGEAGGADEALQAFSATIGKAKEGMPKAVQAFHALGFAPAEIRSFKTVEQALDAVIGRIAGLRDFTQKDAIIDQLGLRGLAPLINEGVERMHELRAEAERIGVVMDSSLIERGARANREFEVLAQVIGIQLKSAFVDLAPVLTAILSTITEWARGISNIVNSLRGIEGKTRSALLAEKAELEAQAPGAVHIETRPFAGGHRTITVGVVNPQPVLRPSGGGHGPLRSSDQDRLDKLAKVDARLAVLDAQDAARTAPPSGTHDLLPKPATGHAPHDDTIQRQASADEALYSATREAAAARAALAIEAGDRAKAEREQVDAELAKREAAFDKEIADVKGDKGITDQAKRRAILATIERAREESRIAATTRKERINRDATADVQREFLGANEETLRGQIDTLQAQREIASTQDQRRDLALRLFDLEDQLARLKLEEVLASTTGTEAEKARARASLRVLSQTRGDRREAVQDANAGPLTDFFKKMSDTTSDLSTSFQQFAVNGIEDVNSGLRDAIANGRSFGDVLHNALARLAADLITLEIQKYLEVPLARALGLLDDGTGGERASILPHMGASGGGGNVFSNILQSIGHFLGFAGGGDPPVGVPYWVGEHGKELRIDRTPGTILNASQIAGMRAPSSQAVRAGAGPVTIVEHKWDLRGAVVTDDLLKQMRAMSKREADGAAVRMGREVMDRIPDRLAYHDASGV